MKETFITTRRPVTKETYPLQHIFYDWEISVERSDGVRAVEFVSGGEPIIDATERRLQATIALQPMGGAA